MLRLLSEDRRLHIGDVVVDSISVPGEIDEWQFTAAAGQQIFIDYQSTSGFLRSTLKTPSGSSFDFTFGSATNDLDRGPFTLPVSGTWTLKVESNGVQTPNYQFQLFDVPAPDTTVLPLSPAGAIADGAIETPGTVDHWQFEITSAGTEVFFDWSQLSGGIARYRLRTPSGSLYQTDFS
jgi:hypothetical protein